METKQRQRLRPRIKLKLKAVIISLVIIGIVITTVIINSFIPKTAKAIGGLKYPTLSFHDPLLISGVEGQVGAVYKFSGVSPGIDVLIEILALYNGARVDDMDHYTAGYYDAWQPFVAAPAGVTSWIDWRITLKVAGTNTDTVVTDLAAAAVDVDGDGGSLKELVEADHVLSYSVMSTSPLSIIFNNDSCQASSSFSNVANIDTNSLDAMFVMTFRNVSSIEYRTGAISSYGGEEIRQNCIYFRYFDFMPTPIVLPVKLISFHAITDQAKVTLQWSTASEVNNDFFTLERSKDGREFSELKRVKGSGNTTTVHRYSYTDETPFEGTSYYRLKQTDYDGHQEQFDPISVRLNTKTNDFKIISTAPNPFHDHLNVNYIAAKEGSTKLLILNETGATVYDRQFNTIYGNNSIDIVDLSLLKKGIYFLAADDGKERTPSVRLMKY